MNANQVRAYANAKWPSAMQSPVAKFCQEAVEHKDAMDHALACLAICPSHDEETLSTNIESNFPDLDLDDCDAIAAAAITATRKPRQALHLAAVKTHLAHCAAVPRIGHYFGITFTASGVPAVVAVATPGA